MATLKAKQLTASGLVTGRRALIRQVLIFHPISADSIYRFYDLTAAPIGSEPYYTFEVYGKCQENFPIVEPGILFDDGIYITVVSGTTVTVFYEEV